MATSRDGGRRRRRSRPRRAALHTQRRPRHARQAAPPGPVYFHGGAFAVHSAFSGAHSRFLTSERARGGGPRGGRVRELPPRAFINPLALPAEEWARLGCRRALVTVAELDTMRDRGRRYVDALRPEGERVGRGGGCSVREPGRGEGHVYFIDKISGDGDKDKAEMAAVVSFIQQSG